MINTISQVRGRVVPRTTVFRFKGHTSDPEKIGHDLNVAAVLSGRLTQRGESLSVQTELIDVRRGSQLWGELYNRRLSDVVTLQQEIAQQISDKLRLQISGADEQRIAKPATRDPEAYDLYLKGRYAWNMRTPENLRLAIGDFQEAIRRDPNFALAYLGLADTYSVSAQYLDVPAAEAIPRAKAAAERALTLDSSLAEAHATLGRIDDALFDWNGGEREFKRAIELKPNNATAHHWLCLHYQYLRRYDDALREIELAHTLDPLSGVISRNIAVTAYLQRRYEFSVEQARRVLQIDPENGQSHCVLGYSLLYTGRRDEAIEALKTAVAIDNRAESVSFLAEGLAMTGDRAGASRLIAQLAARELSRTATPGLLVGPYLAIGDREAAIAAASREVDQRGYWTGLLNADPRYDPLRKDPRFIAILRRAGL